MWGEVIADLIHRAASVVRRGVTGSAEGIRRLIDGVSLSAARPLRRDVENLAGKSGYDASHMDENVKKFMIASAAALSIDWPLRDGKTPRAVGMLFQPEAGHKRQQPRTNGGNRSREVR